MAIYHCNIKIISRGKGQTAIASSAYRSGTKLLNEETGEIHDFTRKSGIVYSEILLCENAPKEYENREVLWNEVQKIEKVKNAQLAREVEVALPREMSREQQIECVRNYVKENFIKEGMCADFSLHDKGDGNPHAHIMLTTRPIKDTGEWGVKERKGYALDEHGERIPLLDENGEQKKDSRNRLQWKREMIQANDWNKREKAEIWRKAWADCCNAYLPKEQHIDHRSYERQGKSQIPTIHEGYVARQMENKQGEQSERCTINREIKELNEKLLPIEEQIKRVQGEQELTLCFMNVRQAKEIIHNTDEYTTDDSDLQKAMVKMEQAEENIYKVLNKSYLLPNKDQEVLLQMKDFVEYTKAEVEKLLFEIQNQEILFDVESAIKELHSYYMEYVKATIGEMNYKEYHANPKYEKNVEQIKELVKSYQEQNRYLEQLKHQQQGLKFYQRKEKVEIRNNIDTIKEEIEKIQLRLDEKGVKDVSRADFIIKDNLYKAKEEKALEMDSKALKPMLQQQREVAKEKFLALAKQVPVLHRSTVLNGIRALRKPCDDFTIMEQMKAEKRANQALEGALETLVGRERTLEKKENDTMIRAREQGMER